MRCDGGLQKLNFLQIAGWGLGKTGGWRGFRPAGFGIFNFCRSGYGPAHFLIYNIALICRFWHKIENFFLRILCAGVRDCGELAGYGPRGEVGRCGAGEGEIWGCRRLFLSLNSTPAGWVAEKTAGRSPRTLERREGLLPPNLLSLLLNSNK